MTIQDVLMRYSVQHEGQIARLEERTKKMGLTEEDKRWISEQLKNTEERLIEALRDTQTKILAAFDDEEKVK